MKKIVFVCVLFFWGISSYSVSAEESSDTTINDLEKTSSIADIENALFQYFSENSINIEKDTSAYYQYLFDQLSTESDNNLKTISGYDEILDYASVYVANYANLEVNNVSLSESTTLNEITEANIADFNHIRDAQEKPNLRASYNRNAAITYARKHSIWQNGNYPYYTSDCTNFASQVVQAGGMKQRTTKNSSGLKWYAKKNNGLAKWDVSNTWINAHQFTVYWTTEGKNVKGYTKASEVQSNAQVGDVLAYFRKSDYQIWHVAVVTKKVNGKIYITQHSVSRTDYKWEGLLDMSKNTVMVIKF